MALSKRVRFEVLRRDNHQCRYCGAAAPAVELTVDHVVPVALGGSDDPSNLVAACRDCNSGKTSIAPDQPLVDQVSEDAVRWSRAMAAAAAERSAEFDARQELAEEFRSRWNQWHTGSGSTAPLPPGWQSSVKSLVAAGLVLSDFEELIEVAMGSRARDTFRYFCGCCWTRVRKAQERAAEILAEEDADDLTAAEQAVWSDWHSANFGPDIADGKEKFARYVAIVHAATGDAEMPEDVTAEEMGWAGSLLAELEAAQDAIRGVSDGA